MTPSSSRSDRWFETVVTDTSSSSPRLRRLARPFPSSALISFASRFSYVITVHLTPGALEFYEYPVSQRARRNCAKRQDLYTGGEWCKCLQHDGQKRCHGWRINGERTGSY